MDTLKYVTKKSPTVERFHVILDSITVLKLLLAVVGDTCLPSTVPKTAEHELKLGRSVVLHLQCYKSLVHIYGIESQYTVNEELTLITVQDFIELYLSYMHIDVNLGALGGPKDA